MIFLRPWFFLLLLALIPLYYFSKKGGHSSSWKKYINKEFIPFLLINDTENQKKKYSFFKIFFFWSVLTVALAGPSFQKVPIESSKPFEGTVLIADLNSVNQNTLTQLKVKLLQAMTLLQEEKIGLVLFDKKGYTALPLSDDKEILAQMISILNPNILPLDGQNLEEAFKQAAELFKNNDLNSGRILLFTGGIKNTEKAINSIKSLPYKIGILGLGNEISPVPALDKNGAFKRDENNNLLLFSPNKKELKKLGYYESAQTNDSDIKNLIQETKYVSLGNTTGILPNDFLTVDEYKDLGAYLVVFLMPFIALLFRKGVLFILIFSLFSIPAQADFWQREDQKIYQSNQKGIQEYQNKKYLDALTRFKKDQSDNGLYNQGNAQAHLGKINEAIDLYKKALEKNPNHKEAAFNKAYLENLINKEKESQNSDNQKNEQESSDSKDQENNSKNSQNNQNSNNSQKNQSDQSNLDNQTQDQNNGQENRQQMSDKNKSTDQQNESPKEMKETKEEESSLREKKEQNKENTSSSPSEIPTESHSKKTPLDQESQEIFNRLKKDPARILKFRLYMQSQRG